MIKQNASPFRFTVSSRNVLSISEINRPAAADVLPDNLEHDRAVYFVLALYGTAGGAAAAKGFLSAVTDSFNQLGHPPDKLAVGRDGRYGKAGGFGRTSAILHKKGFAGVHSLSIFTMLPGFRFMDDTYCHAGWAGDEPCYADICVRADILVLCPGESLTLCRQWLANVFAFRTQESLSVGFGTDGRCSSVAMPASVKQR